MTTQTLSALKDAYLGLIQMENNGFISDDESSDKFNDCLIKAGVEWDDFIAYMEDKGLF